MSIQELLDRAISVATRGVDPSLSSTLSSEMVAEDLIFTVFQEVSGKCAKDRNLRSLLRRPISLNFANGSTTVDGLLTEYAHESNLYDPASPSTIYSFEPSWTEFIRYTDKRIGSYNINESTVNVIQPGAVFVSGAGLNGSLTLVIPRSIEVPVNATIDIDVRDELLDDLVMVLAGYLVPVAVNAARRGA